MAKEVKARGTAEMDADVFGMAEQSSSFSLKFEGPAATLITHAEGREDWTIGTVTLQKPGSTDNIKVQLEGEGAAKWLTETVINAVNNKESIQ